MRPYDVAGKEAIHAAGIALHHLHEASEPIRTMEINAFSESYKQVAIGSRATRCLNECTNVPTWIIGPRKYFETG
jgi:hypothetical protein